MHRRYRWFRTWVLGMVAGVSGLMVAGAGEGPRPKRWTPPAAYQQALQALQAQRWAEAVERLEASLLADPPRPKDTLQAASGYVPYLYLAYTYARLGRPDAAEAFYRLAQRFGGFEHRADLQPYVAFIEQTLEARLSEDRGETSAPSVFYKDQEKTEERSGACQVLPARDPYNLPWYFHYALGKELLERDQGREALRSFQRALLLNPRPESQARTYGMWHTEYRPYYYMTQAFLRLGRQDCAVWTARESIRFREVGPHDPVYPEWRRVLKALGLEGAGP